jgi:2,4-dienoyl-CoA reductase (NADPH2)
VRHLSGKAALRAALTHAAPTAWLDALTNLGWAKGTAVNLSYASAIKARVHIPVIANGGFQQRETVAKGLQDRHCDMVSMARALIANPDLVLSYVDGRPLGPPCSQCNRCVGRTPTSPLGCYDRSRFASDLEMLEQILRFNRSDGMQEGCEP